MPRSFTLFGLAVAQIACGGSASLQADGPAPSPTSSPAPTATVPTATCTLDPGFPQGTTVVTCGLPPHVTLVGVDAGAVYVLTEAGAYYRADLATGARTLLYTAPANLQVYANGLGDDAVLAGGKLLAFTLGNGVWSLDPDKPSTPVNVLGDVFENPPLVNQTSMVFLRAEMSPGLQVLIDVERAPLDGGPTTVLDPTYDSPVALGGDFVYLEGATDNPPGPLLRVPTAGGAVSQVLATLDMSGAPGSIAADADAVYVIGSSPVSGVQGSHAITRFPASGGAPTTLTVLGAFDPEVSGPVPWALRLDDTFVYFLGMEGEGAFVFDATSTLYRVPNATPSSYAETVVTATSMGPPSFDAQFIYIALQRGGIDDPIEGEILRLPKSAIP